MNDNNIVAEETLTDVAGGNEASYNAGVQIGNAFGSLYQGAINATTDAMCAVHNFFTGDEL